MIGIEFKSLKVNVARQNSDAPRLRPKDVETTQRGNAMPNESHQRAAEFHELAAHAHRAAAAHHEKEDHQSGHEHSKQALEHANKAFHWTQEAHRESVKAREKSPGHVAASKESTDVGTT
jgi:hypothetical protein